MPAGEIQLVAYGEENMVLNDSPQITFFKIVYRRYTNFSMETVQTNFIYQAIFGKKYSVEIAKLGDLLHKMWLVIELPDIPIIYNLDNSVDNRIKFKWASKIAYALIDYVEIEIGGQTIDRQWGEWMNVLNELNWNNYNSSLNQYIGNTPELTTYKLVKDGVTSQMLYIPLFFWFCNSSGCALPLLCIEYSIVRFYIQLNNFENCGIFSPSNFIQISSYLGNGILGEPLVQYNNQGTAWGEFDSVEINSYDNNLVVISYYLYYRKISDNQFLTTVQTYYNNLGTTYFDINNKTNFIIYGLKSGSIYIPYGSNPTNPNSIYIQKKYNYILPSDIALKNIYLLIDYVYLDRDERTNFYKNKNEYIIEQVYFSNPRYLINQNNRIYIDMINPCKYFIFMGQVSYLCNPNVNDTFNYNLYFFNNNDIVYNNIFKQKSVIKSVSFSLNSNLSIENLDMNYYNFYSPFIHYPMTHPPSGFGLFTFSVYPDNLQPSGTCNMSCFNNFEINTVFNPIDVDYNNYIFKTYAITYNYLKIVNGVVGTIFNSNF
jgi:hypothetical protein